MYLVKAKHVMYSTRSQFLKYCGRRSVKEHYSTNSVSLNQGRDWQQTTTVIKRFK